MVMMIKGDDDGDDDDGRGEERYEEESPGTHFFHSMKRASSIP